MMETTAEGTFESIATRLMCEPGTERGKAFHNPNLTAGGKIFAMLVNGRLVVKLPAERCAELVASGVAEPFDRGQGRPLKQWVAVGDPGGRRWLELSEEALSFARG